MTRVQMVHAALDMLIGQAETQIQQHEWRREQAARERHRAKTGAPLRRIARRLGSGCCGIYMIRCESTGRIKIGKSTTVATRISSHAINLFGAGGMVGPLRLVRFIPCSASALDAVELMLHWLFRDRRVGTLEIFEAGDIKPETFTTAGDVYRAFAERAREEIEA